MNLEYLTTSRESKGYNKTKISKELDVVRSTITLWEKGDRKPSIDNIVKLCKLLNMDANKLLELE